MILKRKNRGMAKKVLIIDPKTWIILKKGLSISKGNFDCIRNISFGNFRIHRFL